MLLLSRGERETEAGAQRVSLRVAPARAAAHNGPWAYAAAAVVGAVVAWVAVSMPLPGGQAGRFWGAMLLLAVCTLAAVAVLLRARPPEPVDGRVAAIPVFVLAFALSFLANGAGPLLAHQLAWGLLAIGGLLLVAWRLGRGMFPPWLIAFTAVTLLLSLATAGPSGVLGDVGIEAIALFTAWHVAGRFATPGGVVKFLGYVAVAYWADTAIALLVGVGHLHAGSMNPRTVLLPWAAGLDHNKTMYGILVNQPGRLLSAIVCAYHVSQYRARAGRRWVHALLAAGAAVIFLYQYGRIPLIAGLVIVTLLFATGHRGTRVWVIAALSAFALFGFLSAGSDGGGFSLRLGASKWDSGHAILWSQQFTLFADHPVAGVGLHPTAGQIFVARVQPVFPALETLDSVAVYGSDLVTREFAKGSRGEGGWTAVLSQMGVAGSAFVLALVAVSLMTALCPMRKVAPDARRDVILLRAVLVASLLVYVTDVQPAGFTTFTDYVVLQLTMVAVVMTLRRRHIVK